jgi:hypothetical protein
MGSVCLRTLPHALQPVRSIIGSSVHNGYLPVQTFIPATSTFSTVNLTIRPRFLTQGDDKSEISKLKMLETITHLKSQMALKDKQHESEMALKDKKHESELALEKKKVTLEKEKVTLEKEKVTLEKEKYTLEREKNTLLNGARWELFDGLDEVPVEIGCVSEAIDAFSDQRKFCQALVPGKESHVLPDWHRSPPKLFFKTDVFGSPRDPVHELAHIVPHSRDRASLWTSVLADILNVEIDSYPKRSVFAQMKEGFLGSFEAKNRKRGTGLLHQPFNHIALAEQKTWWDDRPSVSIFPNMSLNDMINWDGQAYSAVVVAASPYVVQRIGAIYGDLDEWNGEDSRVENTFRGFRDAASFLIASLKNHLIEQQMTVHEEYLLTGAMQHYLAGVKQFLAPIPKKSAANKYRVVNFSQGKMIMDSASDTKGHPAPMPLLLVAKSLNGWFSHLLQRDKLKGFAIPEGFRGDRRFCAIFPSCRVDESDASCPVCLARAIVTQSDALPALDDLSYHEDEYERIEKIALCEETVDGVEDDPLLTRARDLLCTKVCPQSIVDFTFVVI